MNLKQIIHKLTPRVYRNGMYATIYWLGYEAVIKIK